MSISKQEAERCYPTQYWNGKNWPLKLLSLTTDDLQLAYQSGREAEPCKEQIEAVADALSDLFGGDDTGFHRNDDDWKRTAKYLLNIARIEVM